MTVTGGPANAPAWRVAALVATAAAFAIFAWVAAHWLWRWAAPAPATVATASPADPASAIVASGLWAGAAAPASAARAPANGEIRLLGVLAERDGKGLAVFRTRDGARAVEVGGGVVDGTSLASVDARSVRLRDATGERTLELDRVAPPRETPGPRATNVAAANAGRGASAACAVPAGFAGAVLKLNGELLEGLIAQPDSWRGLLGHENGSLVVREDGGFATMLGLARGDRLLQANGIPLREPDDVVGAVLRPLVASRTVRIAGTRGTRNREIFVVNASACP